MRLLRAARTARASSAPPEAHGSTAGLRVAAMPSTDDAGTPSRHRVRLATDSPRTIVARTAR
ncbi:hypothetical protein [Streptomyces sp. NPDC004100]